MAATLRAAWAGGVACGLSASARVRATSAASAITARLSASMRGADAPERAICGRWAAREAAARGSTESPVPRGERSRSSTSTPVGVEPRAPHTRAPPVTRTRTAPSAVHSSPLLGGGAPIRWGGWSGGGGAGNSGPSAAAMASCRPCRAAAESSIRRKEASRSAKGEAASAAVAASPATVERPGSGGGVARTAVAGARAARARV
eukprot:scaffold15633_cov107-Isochrysis_galbana.AAC.3